MNTPATIILVVLTFLTVQIHSQQQFNNAQNIIQIPQNLDNTLIQSEIQNNSQTSLFSQILQKVKVIPPNRIENQQLDQSQTQTNSQVLDEELELKLEPVLDNDNLSQQDEMHTSFSRQKQLPQNKIQREFKAKQKLKEEQENINRFSYQQDEIIVDEQTFQEVNEEAEAYGLDNHWKLTEIKEFLGRYFGFQMFIWDAMNDPALDAVSYHIKMENQWEGIETMLIMQKLQDLRYENRDKVITLIDVGANIGWFSLAAASKGFNVIAFEPFIENINGFKASIQANSGFDYFITLYEVGLSNEDKTCQLYTYDYNMLNGNIRCDDQEFEEGWSRGQVNITTLDSYVNVIPENALIGVMKIDTEGFEYFILKGGEQFLRMHKVRYILMEYFPLRMEELGYKPLDLLQLLNSLDYEVHKEGFQGPIVISEQDMFKNLLDNNGYSEIYAVYIGQI
eukprot:403377418